MKIYKCDICGKQGSRLRHKRFRYMALCNNCADNIISTIIIKRRSIITQDKKKR